MLKKIVVLLALFVTVGVAAVASAHPHGHYWSGPAIRYRQPFYRPQYRYGYYRPYVRPYWAPYYYAPRPYVRPGVTFRFGW
jgi:hypothetical protein